MSQFGGKPQEAIRGTPKRGCHLTYTSVFHILESQKTVLVKKNRSNSHANKTVGSRESVSTADFLLLRERQGRCLTHAGLRSLEQNNIS